MLGLWLVASLGQAFAQDDAFDDEIIVYADSFARWDHTRWLVNSELVLPMPLFLGADDNLGFVTYALQTRMVLLCDKEHENSKKKIEVACEIEDIGLLATTVRRFAKERDREQVQRVLDQIDAKLTGTKIQLQVDVKGGVNNVDLEGLVATNDRERTNIEELRQLLLRVVAGFHMKLPDHAQRAGKWYEYNSKLMELPSITASRGSSTMVHTVSQHRNGEFRYQIVQTLGQGNVAVTLPNFNARDPDVSMAAPVTRSSGEIATLDAPSDVTNFAAGRGNESSVELSYDLATTGVAIFERETGIMTERVWVTKGTPTASSAGGTLNNPFRNVGRIQMLGEADRPDVGVTAQVAWPGRKMEGLVDWVELDVTPGR